MPEPSKKLTVTSEGNTHTWLEPVSAWLTVFVETSAPVREDFAERTGHPFRAIIPKFISVYADEGNLGNQ